MSFYAFNALEILMVISKRFFLFFVMSQKKKLSISLSLFRKLFDLIYMICMIYYMALNDGAIVSDGTALSDGAI